MKKSIYTWILILSCPLLLCQCASKDDVDLLSRQLRIVNKKIEDLQQNSVTPIQKRQAIAASQLEQLQNEILMLKSGLDGATHVNRTLIEQNKELEAAFQSGIQAQDSKNQARIAELQNKIRNQDQKLTAQQHNVEVIQQARIQDAEKKAKAAAQAADDARKKRAARQKAARDAQASRSHNGIPVIAARHMKKVFSGNSSSYTAPDSVPVHTNSSSSGRTTANPANSTTNGFDSGMALFNKGSYNKAFNAFETFINKNSSSKKTIEAWFMKGECLYKLKDYDMAILQYQKVIDARPISSKSPAALLRQAMSFEHIPDKDTAEIIYQKVVKDYQNTKEGNTARERLRNL